MVMQRRHRENAAACQLKTQHLHNDGDGLDNKHAANDGEEKFLLTTNSDDANHSADGERTGVSHENFGRVTIEPEKTEPGADERGADHR